MSAVLIACFALSGATSLVLQVVWVRKLIEVFGSSTLAISTVLATFMGGLALGSWLGGKIADRAVSIGATRPSPKFDPLLYYAAAEAMVAMCALAIPGLAESFRGINASLWSHLSDWPVTLSIARFAVAALVLGIPTTAMGATLPFLSRRVTRSDRDLAQLGKNVGWLYAANTTGAVVGAAMAGFFLIPAIGVSATNRVAATTAGGLALAVAAAVFALHRRRANKDRVRDTDDAAPDLDESLADDVEPPHLPSPQSRRVALIAYAVSGAVAMSLEVYFSRALAITIGSSILSFTLVLVVFLIGIAVGSALMAPFSARTKRPLALLAWLFLAIALAIAFAHVVIDDLPNAFLLLLEGTRLEVTTVLWVHTVLTGLVILPAALGLGAVMPAAMRAYVGSLEEVGSDVGRAYAANTVGAIVGAFAAGFMILPVIGLEWGVRTAAIVDALLAGYLAWRIGLHKAFVAVAGLVCLFGVLAPAWDRSDFTAGMFRTRLAKSVIESGGLYQRDVVFYRDGVSTTVSVEHLSNDQWTLKNNGKVEASNKHDMPTQILVGLLPVLFHDSDDVDVFVVGYGSGVTVGAITAAPQVTKLDVVELEPAVLEAADTYFSDFNRRPQDDPRVTRYIGDGRNVLLAGGKQYDVIVSEPSNPWIAGVASLFSTDFYELAKAHLAPGGVYCQWAQMYELGARNVKMIYRTFYESFPYVYAVTPSDRSTDTILIGSLEPLELDFAKLDRRMKANATLRAELERGDTTYAGQIIGGVFMVPGDMAAFTAGAPVNTDDRPRLEYLAPRDLLASSRGNRFAQLVRGDFWPYGRLEGVVAGLGVGADRLDRQLEIARGLLEFGRLINARRWLDAAVETAEYAPSNVEGLLEAEQMFALCEPRDYLDPELPVTEGGAPLAKPSASDFVAETENEREAALESYAEGLRLVAEGRFPPAYDILRELPERADTDAGRDISYMIAYAAYKSLDLELAKRLLRELIDRGFSVRRPAVRYYLGRSLYGQGMFRDGLAQLDRFRREHPTLAREAVDKRLGSR